MQEKACNYAKNSVILYVRNDDKT